MNNRLTMLLGTGMGALAMYYLDPARGRYRRALARDQLVHAGHKAKHEAGVIRRDMRNRANGSAAIVRSLFDARPADDAVLVERVRACLGRVVSHPASIEVEATDGVITLSGPILADEVSLLTDCARSVRGVKDVRNHLEVHTEPGRVPGLQGTPRERTGQRSAFMQANWSPTTRALGGATGAFVALYGLRREGMLGGLLTASGALLLGRALTNLELKRLLGFGALRHAIDIQKTLRIAAPPEKVFALWNDFTSFPAFTKHVRRVRRIDDHRKGKEVWRWTVRGVTGLDLDFDSVVTAREENRLLAWSTEPGSLVQHAGRVQFHPNADGTTSIDIKMVYNPVVGALGHAIARLLGADPKHQMDDDLMRMKTFLETGKLPHDAAARIGELPRAEERRGPEHPAHESGPGAQGSESRPH